MRSDVRVKRGNIFTSECQTLVNTVNCVGVMGTGIALEFKLRHPEMFERYVDHCRRGRIAIGKLWIYKPPSKAQEKRWVLNFPTKQHWKDPSKIEYLEAGLKKFVSTYREKGIESVAFPVLGSINGRIDEEKSLSVMQEYLVQCDIAIEIYRYDSEATDDLYEDFRSKLLKTSDQEAAKSVKIRIDRIRKIKETLEHQHSINSISQLASIKGIGLDTLEKLFRYIMDEPERIETGMRSHISGNI